MSDQICMARSIRLTKWNHQGESADQSVEISRINKSKMSTTVEESKEALCGAEIGEVQFIGPGAQCVPCHFPPLQNTGGVEIKSRPHQKNVVLVVHGKTPTRYPA